MHSYSNAYMNRAGLACLMYTVCPGMSHCRLVYCIAWVLVLGVVSTKCSRYPRENVLAIMFVYYRGKANDFIRWVLIAAAG